MTFDEIMTARGNHVCKSNRLTRSRSTPHGAYESKLIAYLISKIRPYDAPDTEYTFSIREFCEVARIDNDNGKTYDAIKAAFTNLARECVWIDCEDCINEESLVGWFKRVRIDKRHAIAKVIFNEELAPHLFSLQGKYTSYTLDNVLMLTGKRHYSIALQELIYSYRNGTGRNEHTFSESDLRKKLRLQKNADDCAFTANYEGFSQLCKWVVIPALEDIRKNSYLSFDYTIDKESKSITVSNIKESSDALMYQEFDKTEKYVARQDKKKQQAKRRI